jgi:hypothetical protein
MNVLVAKEMNQNKVTVDILAPLGACMEVVHLEFFLIEERFSALWTPTMLSLRKLLFGAREVFGFRCLPLHPVAPETRIIR